MRARVPALIVSMLLVASRASLAQGSTTLTVTNVPITFAAPSATDFTNGFVPATLSLRFDVDARGGPASTRTTTVQIRATSANLGNSKPLSDFQWSRSDIGTWNSITNTDVTVDSRAVIKNKVNDTWGNNINFRILLSWTTDAPGTYSTSVVLTLTTTQP